MNTIKAGQYYMVSDQLWSDAGMASSGGMLCLLCLEQRIGRPLVIADFTSVVPRADAWRSTRGSAIPMLR